jgi:Ca-activated chloride channel family protein
MLRYVPALLILVLTASAQEPPNIRVTVQLVNVSLTVRAADGRLVTDLTKNDFEILDNGVPQVVSYFGLGVELPLILGLAMDISGSQEHFNRQHQHDIGVFLKSVLRPSDRAFILCFANRVRLIADFSASSHALAENLSDFMHTRRTAPELGPPEPRVLGTAFYDALYYGATLKLASVEGPRKALIVFSDGEDNSSAHHMLDAIEASQSENVVVYGIRYTETKGGRLTARNKYGMRVMERISRETGGADFDAQKSDLTTSFRQIGDELRSSYEIAYHVNGAVGGGFHKIDVRCKKPGMIVRAKTGYFRSE